MPNLSIRLHKLEAQLKDRRGLIRRSGEWFNYWAEKVDQIIAGDSLVDLNGITLEFVDALIASTSGE